MAKHYHVHLYHGSQRIPPTDLVFARCAEAVEYRDAWNAKLQAQMGVTTCRLRIIPCTLLHLPVPSRES